MNNVLLNHMKDMLAEVEANQWAASIDKPNVRDLIDSVGAPEEFSIDVWGAVGDDGCGFSACAIGHACFDDRFPRLVGMLDPNHEFTVGVLGVSDEWGGILPRLGEVFDIRSDQVNYLFMPTQVGGESEETPRDVINRIEKLQRGEA